MKKTKSKIWSVPSLPPRPLLYDKLECRMGLDGQKAVFRRGHLVSMLFEFFRILCFMSVIVLPVPPATRRGFLVTLVRLDWAVGFLRNSTHGVR